MKEWRRVLSCFLAVLLTVYLVPVQVMAEELGDLWPPTTENVVDAPAEVVGEILEQREENRKEFLLTDGTRLGGNLSGGSTLPKRWILGGN